MLTPFRTLEIGEGKVQQDACTVLRLQGSGKGYSDAQIDDYSGQRRKNYHWKPGVHLGLQAQFSHNQEELKGTAGFGFWNAPFGEPSIRFPAPPQAVWFFFGSQPGNLPLAGEGPGRGWFVSTIDAGHPSALAMLAASPLLLLLNQISAIRTRVWPRVRNQMRISYHPLKIDMRDQHHYELYWLREGCQFILNGESVYRTIHSPRGPLGFVCWMDNQYLVATPRGRIKWGTLQLHETQWMKIRKLKIERFPQ